MHPKSFWNKFNKLLKKPPFIILQALLCRIPFRPVEIDLFYLLHLENMLERSLLKARGPATVRRGTVQDIEGLSRCQDKRDIFMKRFTIGDYCFIAIINEQVVGYMWFCAADHHIEDRLYRIEIQPDAIYTYDAYILPEYRNTGIWLKFHEQLIELMNELGKKMVITMIDYGNEPSIKAHQRFGYYPVKRVLSLKIFGFRLYREKKIEAFQQR